MIRIGAANPPARSMPRKSASRMRPPNSAPPSRSTYPMRRSYFSRERGALCCRPLSVNMDETLTPWKFSVEGETGLERDERIGACGCWAGDRGRGEGDPAAVQDGVQAEDSSR